MKILIDTEWFAAIQDLPPKKQKEILTAILNYPNFESDTHLWKHVIKPNIESGLIKYFNKIKNLKQNNSANPQKSGKKNPDSDIDSGRREDIYKIYNSRIDIDNISTTHARTHVRDAQAIIEQTANDLKDTGHSLVITSNLVFPKNDFFDAYRQQMKLATEQTQVWLRKSKLLGKRITYHKIGEIIQKFNKNQKNT